MDHVAHQAEMVIQSINPEIPINITKWTFDGKIRNEFTRLTSCCNNYGILDKLMKDFVQVVENIVFCYDFFRSHANVDYVHFFFFSPSLYVLQCRYHVLQLSSFFCGQYLDKDFKG